MRLNREQVGEFADNLIQMGVVEEDESNLFLQKILEAGTFLEPAFTALRFSEYICNLPPVNRNEAKTFLRELKELSEIVTELLFEFEDNEGLAIFDGGFKNELIEIQHHLISFVHGAVGQAMPNIYSESYHAGKKFSKRGADSE